MPMLMIAAAVAAIAAVWNYTERESAVALLNDARAKLTVLSDQVKSANAATATAEKALSEAQANLTTEQAARAVAEKAVADIKAALASVAAAAGAATPESAAPTAPATGE
jgi:peptidoglycan hydrolase CwlO-like protein